MASFYSGDQIGAIVADVGQHTTKLGWAGTDFPRSYFRSNLAVQRKEKKKAADDDEAEYHEAIEKAKYDYYHAPIEKSSDGDWQVANPVESSSGLWLDRKPKLDGSDWNDLLPTLVRHGYSSLQCDTEDHPLMLVERSFNPPAVRQQTLEMLFEDVKAPAVFLSKEAVLSCYACGRTSGTVVDVGYSGTTVSPVFEGFVEQKGIRRSPVGLYQMDTQILANLDELHRQPVKPYYQRNSTTSLRSPPFHTAARLQLAQECRDAGAGASMNTAPTSNNNTTFHAPHKPFELPDGTTVDVPSAKRFGAADLVYGDDPTSADRRQEILDSTQKSLQDLIAVAKNQEASEGDDTFSDAAAVGLSKRRKRGAQKKQTRKKFSNRPLLHACGSHLEKLSTEYLTKANVANMVCEAAYRCERDQQGILLGNVILGGGGACLGPTDQAVPDTLREQVETIIQQHTPGWRVKMISPGVPERAILAWLGGSILGSLGTFHDMWITKEEYEEWGSAIVNKKCP